MRFTLRLPESGSLKDKRQVVRSVTQRIRNKYPAAVAEVGDNEAWQIATIGVACVSNSGRQCRSVLDEVEAYVRDSRLDAEVLDVETEILDFD
ncbi:MAG TPA: DUF503 domain-containing protein [Dehalococcoidia bacterium]|nr:DUF503 domain-containing protein [Dehalococcoidia bacterium]